MHRGVGREMRGVEGEETAVGMYYERMNEWMNDLLKVKLKIKEYLWSELQAHLCWVQR